MDTPDDLQGGQAWPFESQPPDIIRFGGLCLFRLEALSRDLRLSMADLHDLLFNIGYEPHELLPDYKYVNIRDFEHALRVWWHLPLDPDVIERDAKWLREDTKAKLKKKFTDALRQRMNRPPRELRTRDPDKDRKEARERMRRLRKRRRET